MDRNLRLLWAYDHPTTRYQEVNFYIDAGMEVVVSLGDPSTLRFDKDYHDETHPLYPDWRSSLTLPASVVERLRRVSLTAHDGRVSPDQADLINQFIDVMIVPADAPVIEAIMTWYRGHLLYRVMGAPNHASMLKNLEAIEVIAAQSEGRLWLAPGLRNVIPFGCPTLSRNFVYLNCWVSPERLHYQWAGASSKRVVSTAISYLEFHPFFQDQYRAIKANLTAQPYVVVGKNDKRAKINHDPRILGALSNEELHHAVATSRVFVDAGSSPEHLIWPPVEAMAMGVPVLYPRFSPLASAALDEGYSEADLSDAGMLEDFAHINTFLETHFDDLDVLQRIVDKQRAVFINGCFSRDKAMANMRAYLSNLRERRTRDAASLTPDTIALLGEQARRRGAEPTPAIGSLARIDGQQAVRLGRLLRPADSRGRVGRLEVETNGHSVRRVREGRDAAGYLVIDHLPSLDAGAYRLRAALMVEDGRGELGALAIGAHTTKGYVETSAPVHVSRPGYVEVEAPLVVTRDDVGAPREVRFHWNGRGTVALTWLQLVAGVEVR